MDLVSGKRGAEQRFSDAGRNKIEEDFLQLSGVNCAAIGREADMEAEPDAVPGDFTGSSGQDFLSAAGDGNQAAFAGTLGLEIKMSRFLSKLADQIILKRRFSGVRAVERGVEACRLVRDEHA